MGVGQALPLLVAGQVLAGGEAGDCFEFADEVGLVVEAVLMGCLGQGLFGSLF